MRLWFEVNQHKRTFNKNVQWERFWGRDYYLPININYCQNDRTFQHTSLTHKLLFLNQLLFILITFNFYCFLTMSDLLSSIQQIMSRFDSFFQFLERSTLTSIYNFHLWFKHAEYSFKSLSELAYPFLFNNVNTTDFDDAILASLKIIYNDCWRVRRSNMRESYIKRLLNWF